MKKLIAVILIVSSSSACMAWNVTDTQLSEITGIRESINSSKITLPQSKPLFISRYLKGNKLCGVVLSGIYEPQGLSKCL